MNRNDSPVGVNSLPEGTPLTPPAVFLQPAPFVPRPRILALPLHRNAEGALVVADGVALPFVPVRAFWIFDVPRGTVRGNHAHRAGHQLAVAISGSCVIRTLARDGGEESFAMAGQARALHIPPGVWDSVETWTPGTVLLVLASLPYDPADYLEDRQEFLTG